MVNKIKIEIMQRTDYREIIDNLAIKRSEKSKKSINESLVKYDKTMYRLIFKGTYFEKECTNFLQNLNEVSHFLYSIHN